MASQSTVNELREARDQPSVLKAELAQLRSRHPSARVIVFEGPDDKVVYGQWIRSIDHEFAYEPMVCGGKRKVRALKNICARDKGNTSENVFYVVDHDFNGLDGFVDTGSVYCTSAYSFENHLVNRTVLDLILRDLFPCEGQANLRGTICDLFEQDYDEFLRISRSVNYLLFLARKSDIGLSARITNSLTSLANVEIGAVAAGNQRASEIIRLSRRATAEEIRSCVKSFRALDERQKYRGKFALKFFTTWLRKLADEYRDRTLGTFGELDSNDNVRAGDFTIGGFASRCPPPECFRAFISVC